MTQFLKTVRLDNAAQSASNVASELLSNYLPITHFEPPPADWWKEGNTPIIYAGGEFDKSNLKPINESRSLLEDEFSECADRWENQVGLHSSPVVRFMHKDYQTIMAKGKSVIPFILERMKKKPDDWFWALKHITGEDAAEKADSFDTAIKAWLEWGAENGYISE